MSLNIRLAALLVLVGALFSMPTVATAQETVDVTLGPGFIMSATPSSVDAGPTIFTATNLDAIVHNLRVIKLKTGQTVDNLPIDALLGAVDETQVNVVAFAPAPLTANLPEGESASTPAVTLAPGAYALICNFPTHYQSGQFVAFQVTGQLPPTDTPAPTATTDPSGPAPTATPDSAAAPTSLPPTGAEAPVDSAGGGWWVLVLLGAAGLGLSGLALGAHRRSR